MNTILSLKNLFCFSYPQLRGNYRFCPDPARSNNSKLDELNTKISREAYRVNYKAILDTKTAVPGGYFTVQNHRLVYQKEPKQISPAEKEKGLRFLQEILNQAWGEVVDAQNSSETPVFLEKAIHRVDQLQDKIRELLPLEDADQLLMQEKWALIIVNNYKKQLANLYSELQKNQPAPCKDLEYRIQELERKLDQQQNKLDTARKYSQKKYIYASCAGKEGGINRESTLWVKKPDKINYFSTLPQKIQKAQKSEDLAKWRFSLEGFKRDFSSYLHRESGKVYAINKSASENVNWEFSNIAWINELLGCSFDQLTGRRFGTATSVLIEDKDLGLRTAHAFKKHDGKWNSMLNPFVDLEAAHMFVLFNVLLKTQDSHIGNILYRKQGNSYIPIPIDLGRLLSPDPLNSHYGMIRFTGFLKWKNLNRRLHDNVRKFIENLDVNHIISSLAHIFENHPRVDEKAKLILQKKLEHLKANLLMAKEAAKHRLSPLDMLALSTYELSEPHLEEMNKITTAYEGDKRQRGKLRRYVMAHCYSGFATAWKAAYQSGKLNEEVFIQQIRIAIQKVLETEVTKRYFNSKAQAMFGKMHL